MPTPHISYSSWMLWRQCQQRWKLDYLDGRRHPIYGVHMDFGTCIHNTLEKLKCRAPDVTLTIDDHIGTFREKFTALHTKNHPKYKQTEQETPIDFFLGAGENILRRFHECGELAEAEVVYNEHALLENIERSDIEMKFKGFIDMVIKTKDKRGNTILYVCDFKTCSWGWSREKREDRELHFQILLYKHFLAKKFGLDPKLVRTAFVLLKKKPSKGSTPVEFFPISAGPVSVQRALDTMNSDITEMLERERTDNFHKNRSACVNDFGESCPYLKSPLCPD